MPPHMEVDVPRVRADDPNAKIDGVELSSSFRASAGDPSAARAG
jgi:hypothetical protein